MHRYSIIFHALSNFKNIASKKKSLFFFFFYLAQCSVTEAKYLHDFIMKCHFSFAFSQKFPRENQYLNWRAVYPLASAPRIGSNAKAKENLSDSEARCVSHQLGKFRVGCHAGFAGVMLNQGQLPSVWLRFELCHTARTRPMQMQEFAPAAQYRHSSFFVSLALGAHLPDLLPQQAGQKYLGQKHLEKVEKMQNWD